MAGVDQPMADFFNVVFAGNIAAGANPAAVKANIARIFKANDAMVEKLFSGQRIAVKKAVDQATAMKYRAVMKQAGAVALVEACDEQGKPLASAAPAAAVSVPVPASEKAPTAVASTPTAVASTPTAAPMPTSAPTKAPTMAERLALLAAEQAKNARPASGAPPPADRKRAATWKLFPSGALLSEARSVPAPMLPNIAGITLANVGGELLKAEERRQLAPTPVVVPDISAITLAPAGGDLVKTEERRQVTPVQVDVSALSMAPANTDMLKESERRVVVPVVVDVSAMTVAPPGVDLEQIKEEKKPVNPDISHIRMA